MMAKSWYREDAFLNMKKPASFDPVQPGNIGGVKPDPKTMKSPTQDKVTGPKVIETHCTDSTMIEREEKATDDTGLSPVAAMDADDASYSPGRQEDGNHEGAPELYQPGDGAANLFKCEGCGGTCGGPHVITEKGSGDFTDCMQRIVPKAKPDDPEAFCAWYEHEQTGRWPGEKRASKSEGPQIIE